MVMAPPQTDWLDLNVIWACRLAQFKRHVLSESTAARVCQVSHFRNLAMSFRLQAATQIGELECDVAPRSTVELDFHHNHITFLKLVFTDLHKVDADTALCVAASGHFFFNFFLFC